MEREELNNLSKEELMERIKTKCVADIKPLKVLGYFFLVILVYDILYYGFGDRSGLHYCTVPAIIVLWSFVEVWWKNRMSKCDDASRMIRLHEDYYKYHKVEHIIALIVWVPLSYSLFKDFDASTTPLGWTVLFVGFWIAVFCWVLWRLIKLRKYLFSPEIDRLQKLVNC